MTGTGPMVVDWANAAAGDPALDAADAWVLIACASPPATGLDRWIVPVGRRVMLRSFLNGVDTNDARRAVPVAVEQRLTDPHLTPDERARMRVFATRVTNA